MSIIGPFVSHSYVTVLSSNSDISVYSIVGMLENTGRRQREGLHTHTHQMGLCSLKR